MDRKVGAALSPLETSFTAPSTMEYQLFFASPRGIYGQDAPEGGIGRLRDEEGGPENVDDQVDLVAFIFNHARRGKIIVYAAAVRAFQVQSHYGDGSDVQRRNAKSEELDCVAYGLLRRANAVGGLIATVLSSSPARPTKHIR